MTTTLTYKDRFRRVFYFFPFQLLFLHFKKNHLLLLCWLVLFGYVLRFVSARYGIPYLILAPEYFGRIGFPAFFLVGLALGGFITAFNLYSYALHAFRFPFIATVARPFTKFSINNALIPLVFLITYITASIDTQVNQELISTSTAVFNVLGLLAGVAIFILVSHFYFGRTNTDIIKILGTDVPPPDAEDVPRRRSRKKKKTSKWFNIKLDDRKWHVETYLANPFRVALARTTHHYDEATIKKVLWQHHVNGSFFEILLIVSFLGLGAFGNISIFEIPAGASIFMLYTMILMLIAALFSWLKGWTLSILVILFVGVNYLSQFNKDIFYESHAHGLDYTKDDVSYDLNRIVALGNDQAAYDSDKQAMIQTLNKWKGKNDRFAQGQKPKLVLITVSGGGSRSMLWTYRTMQVTDSLLGGTLMDRTALVTGSSGGLVGASYYRQLYHQEQTGTTVNRFDRSHVDAVSQDVLNPIGFSLVTNDLFFRYRKVYDGDLAYTRDRGFAFEGELNANLGNALDVRLSDMVEAEQNADVPVLLVSPTCINDGRRLLISSSPVSFLCHNGTSDNVRAAPIPGTVEYAKIFAQHDPLNVKLTSALRMSATFPYIMPMVSLPSEPTMKIMDAGIRDNYGMGMTIKFIHEFQDWIAANTGGVVILQIRDLHKDFINEPNDGSLLARIFRPVGNVTGNMLHIQDMEHDESLNEADSWAQFPIDVVPIELQHDNKDEISLSWHLTVIEKMRVLDQVDAPRNKAQFDRLTRLLPLDARSLLLSQESGDR